MDKYLSTALKAAEKSSKILRQGFKQGASGRKKQSDNTANWITEYDLRAEKAILEVIQKHFPDHSVMAEEGTSDVKQSDYQWIVDPLDGTTNFLRGIKEFAVSIALTHKNKLLLGVISDPTEKQIYSATAGRGAFLNGKKISVSKVKNLKDALVALSMQKSKAAYSTGAKNFKALSTAPTKPRVFGSITLALAWVASGKLDAAVFNNTQPWDIAAGIIMIEEAGGKISRTDQGEFSLTAKQMVASNKALHNKLLKILK